MIGLKIIRQAHEQSRPQTVEKCIELHNGDEKLHFDCRTDPSHRNYIVIRFS